MFSLEIHRRALALAFAATAWVVGGLAAAAPALAEDVTVIWPESTKINPDTMSYEVLTTGTLAATDYFWAAGSGMSKRTPVEPDGSTTVDLTTLEGNVRIELYRCVDWCWMLAPTQRLEVRSELAPSDTPVHPFRFGPSNPDRPISFEPAGVTSVDVSWEVFEAPSDGSSAPVLAGHVEDAPVPFVMPRFEASDLVHNQLYDVKVTFAADTAWGRLEAVRTRQSIWDTAVEVDVWQNLHTIYPVRDDYRDELLLRPTWDNESVWTLAISVRDEAGVEVHRYKEPGFEVRSGQLYGWVPGSVPEGTYTATLEIEDRAGNTQRIDREVEVVNKELRLVEWSETYRADEVMVDHGVGRCGSLKSPARAAWRGSIGYRTASSCRRSQQWYASTVHGAYVPYSFTDKYLIRVSAFGGKPKADKRSYLKMFYRNREDDDWIDGGYFGDRVGLHDGYEKRRSIVLGQGDKKPYVLWNVGLAGGYNYDVKSFTVEVRYETLTY